MKKQILGWIFSSLGAMFALAYVYNILKKVQKINSESGIIGGADTPTLMFLIKDSPVIFLIIAVILLSAGIILKKSKL